MGKVNNFSHHKDKHRLTKKPLVFFKKVYLVSTGYSYSNLGRLFLRLFLGLMLVQFATHQLYNFKELEQVFPAVLGMSARSSLIWMVCIELFCGFFIMFGFLTRFMLLPPFFAMIVGEFHMLYDTHVQAPYLINWDNPMYLPVMFMGLLFFLLLVGPGKISVDYFLSLHIIHSSDRDEQEELEEM